MQQYYKFITIILILVFSYPLNEGNFHHYFPYSFPFLNARRIREDNQFQYEEINEDEFRQRLKDNNIEEDTIDKIILTLNNRFSSQERNKARGIIYQLLIKIKNLDFNLSNIFKPFAIDAIEASENNIDNLVSNSETLVILSEFIKENVEEKPEDMLRFSVDEAFQNSQKITEEFRHNIKALKKILERFREYGVDFKTLKIVSYYCSKNSAKNPLEYQRNLGFIGEVMIGGLNGRSETASGRVNEIGKKFVRIEKTKRPNPEYFLNKYLPLVDKVSWLNPNEFRSNLSSFAFNAANLLLNDINPEPIIDIAYNYVEGLSNSPQEFRYDFTRICKRTPSLKIESLNDLLVLLNEIINVSGENFKSFDKNITAVINLKKTLKSNEIDIGKTLLVLVKAGAKASGNISFQFKENLGNEEGIGHLVNELKGIIGVSDEIEDILIKEVPESADKAYRQEEGKKIALLFRELLQRIIEEYYG